MRAAILAIAAAVVPACDAPPATLEREPCAYHDPQRQALFGDLHVHTGFSFDARSYDTVVTPDDAYRFARGEPVVIEGGRTVQLRRPLDFAAVTDHSEFLGEVAQCTDPDRPRYNVQTCKDYRDPAINGAALMALKLSVPGSARFDDVCGAFDFQCTNVARERWEAMQKAALGANDRSSECRFTSFPAYEYTNTTGVSNLHRNVVFASDEVPELPYSMFEAPTPFELWDLLDRNCRKAGTGCDVVVLPHNSNLSNGNLFYLGDELALPADERKRRAQLRAELEPIVEVFQHKGDSECRNGLGSEDDPLCEFEKLRPSGAAVCPEDAPGSGGMRLGGCVHRLDFVRNVLTAGMAAEDALGVNPYRLGFIGSTDTHNGTPGNTSHDDFPGHVGTVDDTDDKRLGPGNVTHDGIINNPGGLAGVWAEENSRESIFAALRRRETFATSGPRMKMRFFAGDFDASVCQLDYRGIAATGYERGVPMGSVIDAPATAPALLIHALADALPLTGIQVIKGWVDADGAEHQKVYDLATATPPPVDPDTCERGEETGWYGRCEVWRDPDYDPSVRAFYYVRILESPTCRWSARACAKLPAAGRPVGCDDPEIEPVVQQRAWSSPIWLDP